MNKSKLQVCFSIDAIARSPFYAILPGLMPRLTWRTPRFGLCSLGRGGNSVRPRMSSGRVDVSYQALDEWNERRRWMIR